MLARPSSSEVSPEALRLHLWPDDPLRPVLRFKMCIPQRRTATMTPVQTAGRASNPRSAPRASHSVRRRSGAVPLVGRPYGREVGGEWTIDESVS